MMGTDISQMQVVELLKELAGSDDLDAIKFELSKVKDTADYIQTAYDYKNLPEDVEQILNTRTVERVHYYINRLIRSLEKTKPSPVNDMNLYRWKEYKDVLTDSLWVIPKRDTSGVHHGGYWGNFVPQIPNQLLRRYTKKGDWVLDPFLGSGTTLIEAKALGRNGIGVELQDSVAHETKKLVDQAGNPYNKESKIIQGNSALINLEHELSELHINKVQFLMLHPPYWDIIKFSESKDDLSNAASMEEFLHMLGAVVDNMGKYLADGRFMALIISDKYSKGEWIPLGFLAMQMVQQKNYLLKSVIVKNFEETKGKMNQKELWRYRALSGGFYVFKHEYIFIFQKRSM